MATSGELHGDHYITGSSIIHFQELLAAHNTYIRASKFWKHIEPVAVIGEVEFSFEELRSIIDSYIDNFLKQ